VDEPIRPTPRARLAASLQCLLVTVLWATSWVLIEVGVDDMELAPIGFAGVRYALAAALLAPLGWRALRRAGKDHEPIDRALLVRVAILGIAFYTLAQGAQYVALAVLPVATLGLLLASIPAWVAIVAALRGEEAADRAQLAGIAAILAGALLYFGAGAVALPPLVALGFLAAAVCIAASTAGTHLSRDLARDALARVGGATGLTAGSMAIGGVALLAIGVAVEGFPALDARGWAIVGWLAAVNTAFAFTLLNHTLRVLTAVEVSAIVNLLPIIVALLAWLVLGQPLGPLHLAGIALTAGGAAAVQLVPVLRRRGRRGDERPA
jgi:drug/metabolite transporter (DMT)-like permease